MRKGHPEKEDGKDFKLDYLYVKIYSKKKFIYPCVFPHVSRFISVANSYIRNGEPFPFPFPFEKTT